MSRIQPPCAGAGPPGGCSRGLLRPGGRGGGLRAGTTHQHHQLGDQAADLAVSTGVGLPTWPPVGSGSLLCPCRGRGSWPRYPEDPAVLLPASRAGAGLWGYQPLQGKPATWPPESCLCFSNFYFYLKTISNTLKSCKKSTKNAGMFFI